MEDKLTMEDIEKIHAFEGISNSSKEDILKIGRIREFKKDSFIFHVKDKIEHFYAVLAGKVSLSRINIEGQKRVFFLLGQGDLVNEVVFDNLPVTADCQAFEYTLILEINKDEFLKIMEADFKLTMNILNSIGRKERRLYRQLKNTLAIGIDKKLAAKLWKLSRDSGEKAGQLENNKIIDQEDWKYIDMDISVTYISYMLGTSRESISRAMKILIDRGICKWIDRKLYVKEKELLEYYRK